MGLGPAVTHVGGGRHGNGRHGDEENQEEGLVHGGGPILGMVEKVGHGGSYIVRVKHTTRRLGIIRQELPAHLHVVCSKSIIFCSAGNP